MQDTQCWDHTRSRNGLISPGCSHQRHTSLRQSANDWGVCVCVFRHIWQICSIIYHRSFISYVIYTLYRIWYIFSVFFPDSLAAHITHKPGTNTIAAGCAPNVPLSSTLCPVCIAQLLNMGTKASRQHSTETEHALGTSTSSVNLVWGCHHGHANT